jgi:predicted metal-dependent phosphoesterase TrpH
MSEGFDLHTHTIHSDGTLTPSELVEHALSQDVKVMALTDHDSTAGISEARKKADLLGLKLITGVEISVSWANRTIHIVGLGVDTGNENLQQGLKILRGYRDDRAIKIAERLQQCGIEDCQQAVKEKTDGTLIGRMHYARYLVEQGHAKDIKQAFKRYLGDGKRAFVAVQWASLTDAVSWINAAGGKAVIAHPARYGLSTTRMRLLLSEFKECGGAAIEVVSGSHTETECLHFAGLANAYGLQASVGSDYHGPENPWIELGRMRALPKNCLPVWQDW